MEGSLTLFGDKGTVKIGGQYLNELEYFDVADMIEKLDGGYLPYTPPVNLLRGFRVAIDMIFEEGLENIWKRHYRLAEGTRRAITEGWGLNLCAKEEKIFLLWLKPS